MSFCSRFICVGQHECSVKSFLTKCFTSFCKLKRTDLKKKIWYLLRRSLWNFCLTKSTNWNSWFCPSSTLSPNNSETSTKRHKKAIHTKNKESKVLVVQKTVEGKRTICQKGDLPLMKEMKTMTKMMTRKKKRGKMRMTTTIIIDRIAWRFMPLNCGLLKNIIDFNKIHWLKFFKNRFFIFILEELA